MSIKVAIIVSSFILGIFAGSPSLKPVPIKPCGDYVSPGTTVQTSFNNDCDYILNWDDIQLKEKNETHWADPRSIYDPALKSINENTLQSITDSYWNHVVQIAQIFEADPYDMYYIMEHLGASTPRPYNCLLGVLSNVVSQRQNTILQSNITLTIFLSFRDEWDAQLLSATKP